MEDVREKVGQMLSADSSHGQAEEGHVDQTEEETIERPNGEVHHAR